MYTSCKTNLNDFTYLKIPMKQKEETKDDSKQLEWIVLELRLWRTVGWGSGDVGR